MTTAVFLRAKSVRHFDDAAGVVRIAPGADIQVGIVIVDEHGRLEPLRFDYRLHEFRIVGQKWFRVVDWSQTCCRRLGWRVLSRRACARSAVVLRP